MDAREALRQWWIAYTEGPEFSPWPNDPDGGEGRIAAALEAVLNLHQPTQYDGLTVRTGQVIHDLCSHDQAVYPCPTVLAITTELTKENTP